LLLHSGRFNASASIFKPNTGVLLDEQKFDLKETAHSHRIAGLWQLMTGYHGIYLAATVAIAVATLSRTAINFLLLYFVDDVLGRPDILQVLPWVALGFVGLAASQGLFTYYSGRWAAYSAEGVARKMRDYLYDHLQRLSFTYHDQTQTGELISRVTSDVDAVRRFYAEQAIGTGRIFFLFLINFTGIYILSPYLAWTSVIVIPIVVLMSIYFFREVGKAFEIFQEQESKLSNRFQEHVSGIRVVKAFARQTYETDRFEVENTQKFRVGIKFGLLHGTFWPITDILCAGQMLFSFYLGAILVMSGDITLGTYLAFAQMIIFIIWPIRNLGRLITQMSTAVVSFSRLQDIIAQDEEPLKQGDFVPQHGIVGSVRFQNVSFHYESSLDNEAVERANTVGMLARNKTAAKRSKSEMPVLDNITFEAKPGMIVALLGGTGSGKTSLVNLLDRFYDYQAGQIYIDDVPLERYPREYLRHHVGIVMQEPFLFSRSIRDNITYGLNYQVTDEEVYAAAKAAAVHDVILSFPQGYNTMVGERGVTLSGGQKQRVTLARTLLKNPRILILDDATSSVDTETEAEIREALDQLMEHRTTFVIAHRIQSVMIADLILVLDEGRIIQSGTHAELIGQAGVYRDVFNLQASLEDDLQVELDGMESS
ncbi:MAG: ABC transporter ATP-binding protein, partial [Chloroflexota bacterium]